MSKKLCLLALVLSLVPFQTSAASNLVITEIAAFETSAKEWIEVYNRGDTPLDITGYKLWEENTNHSIKLFQGQDLILAPQEYAIICNDCAAFVSAYAPPSQATLIDSAWTSLNEQGELIGIKDAQGNLLESFTYIPSSKGSLQRIHPLSDDYTEKNWLYIEGAYSLLTSYISPQAPLDPAPIQPIPIPADTSVIYLDDNAIKPSPNAKAMVMLLTPDPLSLPSIMQGDHTFKPYKLMLYYLDSYTGLNSLQDYLNRLTQAFDQQMISDNPEDHVQQIAEEIPLEELQEEPMVIPDVLQQTAPTQTTIPEEILPPAQPTAEVSDDMTKTCMAWWEKNHQTITQP